MNARTSRANTSSIQVPLGVKGNGALEHFEIARTAAGFVTRLQVSRREGSEQHD